MGFSRVLTRENLPFRKRKGRPPGSLSVSFVAGRRGGCYAGAQAPDRPILKQQQGKSSMKVLIRTALLGSLFLVPVVLYGQGGCTDSPECPTAILGVVGTAGAALFVRWRSR